MHLDLTKALGFDYSDSREIEYPIVRTVFGDVVRITFSHGTALLHVPPEE
jgi:hypothetical protein